MSHERARILNVNDNPASLYLTTLTLQRAGYEVLEAMTGAQALEKARQAPDLILLDVRLPDLSGHAVCARLKEDPQTSSITILQTSANDVDVLARTTGLEAGADGYLAQPYEAEELLAWVKALLRARQTLMASHTRLLRLQQVTAALCYAVTPEEVTAVILHQGLDALQAQAGGVALRSEDGQTVEMVNTRGYPEFSIKNFRRQPSSAQTPMCLSIVRNEPIYLETAEMEAAFPMVAKVNTVGGSRVALPFSTSTGLRGCLAISFRQFHAFDAHDRAFMMGLAHQCGQALDRARLYAEAKALARSREELLAIVAHDLRNPLAAVTTSTEIIRRTLPIAVPPLLESRLNSIDRSAERMNHLIQDLLDLARFQAGTLVLRQEHHGAKELLQEVLDSHAVLASEKALRLHLEPAGQEARVRCDRERMMQVFSNLVGNAIKFTPAGGQIILSVDSHPAGVVFSVRDTGPGISSEHLPRLFHRFFQVEPARRNGVGLGLSIVKAIVDAHGGTISVESALGQGTIFRFALPHQGSPAQA
ncbi:sensor histidine kinase [Hyalangium minutum]|uniref:histidine kinase n=1 Tax=Hyalangium minutum TaxID=394096 RepID=A0A085W7Q3_9BACT|nr:hybrid sensor histidine kinase/response regulator [Hyalangium minutum]KFE63716.1 Sensory box histidine kinase [Hyalangium minutum]